MDLGHWEYPGEFDINDWFGFVYRIIDLTNNREYIGKKQFFSTTSKPPKKGKSRRTKITKESDWRKYTSSSTHVNAAITEKGKENFRFLIESLHENKSSLHYAEIEAQVLEDVLRETLDTGERKFYNAMIGNVKFLPKKETSAESAAKIKKTLTLFWMNTDHHYYNKMSDEEKTEWDKKYRIGENDYRFKMKNLDPEKYENWLNEHRRGENNPMFGKTGELHPNFGKKLSEEELIKHSERIRKAISDGKLPTGEKHRWYGVNRWDNLSEKEKETMKQHYSDLFSGEKNPMYGIPCTYKMSEEKIQEWKENISKASKGKPKPQSFKDKMTGRRFTQDKVTCPHCLTSGGKSNMTRYHFDFCKKKPQ